MVLPSVVRPSSPVESSRSCSSVADGSGRDMPEPLSPGARRALECDAMDEFASRFEAFAERSEHARLRAWLAGEAEEAALSEVDERFEDVTSGDGLERIRAELDEARLEEEREARLRELCTVESAVLAARVRRLGAELRARESQQTPFGGPPVAVAELAARLASEGDAARRAEMRDALDRAAGEVDELREERFARAGQARAELGHVDGLARARVLHPQIDFEAWGAAAERLLEASEPSWLDALAAASRRAGIRGAAVRGDIPHLLRAGALDTALPVARIADCFDYAFDHFGVRLADACALEFCRPDSASDARSFAVCPPGEVAISARFVYQSQGPARGY